MILKWTQYNMPTKHRKMSTYSLQSLSIKGFEDFYKVNPINSNKN